MTNWDSLKQPKDLDVIFNMEKDVDIEFELGRHLHFKRYKYLNELTEPEKTFVLLKGIGSTIPADGFISVFHQFLSPDSFKTLCAALTEVGGTKLRELLQEAWSIYTKDRHPITLDELQTIPVRRFNTREKMDRFDDIGLEVEACIQLQYRSGEILSAIYAKKHRDGFTPFQEP